MAKNESYSVKREIANAVMRLMADKSYIDITVTDIITEAKVARASFYRNFGSINDVIDMIVDESSDEFVEDVLPVLYSKDERKWREFLFNYFYLFTRKQQHFKKLLPQNMDVMFSRMDSKMQQKDTGFPSETIHDKYMTAAKMGLLHDITKKWADNGMKETPEEMIDYIMSIVLLF